MHCETVKEMLWAYLEQETTAEEAVEIEKHLAGCAACREEYDAQKEILGMLSNLPEEELPEGYHAELMQKIQAEAKVVPITAKKKKQPIWRQWGMIAAAVLMVIAAGGMEGLLSMREGQQAAVEQARMMQAAEMAEDAADAEVLMDTVGEMPAENEKSAAAGAATQAENTGRKAAKAQAANDAKAAVEGSGDIPETAAETAGTEGIMPFSGRRSVDTQAAEFVSIQTADIAAAKAAVQEAIAAAEGYEEVAEAENSVIAVIPTEGFASFAAALEEIGSVEWIQTADEVTSAYRHIEIELIQ